MEAHSVFLTQTHAHAYTIRINIRVNRTSNEINRTTTRANKPQNTKRNFLLRTLSVRELKSRGGCPSIGTVINCCVSTGPRELMTMITALLLPCISLSALSPLLFYNKERAGLRAFIIRKQTTNHREEASLLFHKRKGKFGLDTRRRSSFPPEDNKKKTRKHKNMSFLSVSRGVNTKENIISVCVSPPPIGSKDNRDVY